MGVRVLQAAGDTAAAAVPHDDAAPQQHNMPWSPAASRPLAAGQPGRGADTDARDSERHVLLHCPSSSPAAAVAALAATTKQSTPRSALVSRLSALHTVVWGSGVACVLLAALIFAFAALLVKLTGNRVPVLEITLLRSAASLVVSFGLIKLHGVSPAMGHAQSTKWLIPRGLFGATAMTTFYASILLLPLADGMTLFFLNPCLTAVAEWAIRGEPLGLVGAAGVVVSLGGMVVLIHPPMLFGGHEQWGARRLLGTGLGLVSAVCCAGAFICIRFVGRSEPAIVVAVYFHMCTALLSVVPLALSWPQAPVPLSWFDAGLLAGVAAGSFLGQLFMTRGLQLENASLMSSLNFSQVLYSYIFGIVFFSEHLSLFGVLGSVLVAVGMLCVTIKPKKSAAATAAATAPDAAAGTASDTRDVPEDPQLQRLLSGQHSFSSQASSQLQELASLSSASLRTDSLLSARQDSFVATPQQQQGHLVAVLEEPAGPAGAAESLRREAAAAQQQQLEVPGWQQQQTQTSGWQRQQQQQVGPHPPVQLSALTEQQR